MTSSTLCLVYLLGSIARVCLFLLPGFTDFLNSRPEITTPATSWNKVTEGLFLFNHTGSLHNGDSYHGSTLMLIFASCLKMYSSIFENLFFISCDVVAAIALYKFAKTFLLLEYDLQNKNKKSDCEGVSEILISEGTVQNIPVIISVFYILYPFTMVTCAVKSTVTISNMLLALFLFENIRLNIVFSTLFLALSAYENFYTVQLILVTILTLYKYNTKNYSLLTCTMQVLLSFASWIAVIIAIAYFHEKTFFSLFDHFHFILTVPDQTPNIGIFWYFFTEIFDHFQAFFIFVFQFHVTIFSLPMFFKFKSEPILFAFATIGIIAIFKSYPAFGDSALWLCLIPLWSQVFRYLRFHVVGPVMIVTAIVLCPIMWNLWIFAQSANANFFFAATLVYNMAQVFILADVVRAYLEWLYHLKQGLNPKLPETNEDARLRLRD